MEVGEVMGVVLPIVYVVVGIALVWFVVELVLTVRKTRSTVEDMKKQIDPTLESVQRMTKSLEPVVDKVDPLVDRVSLTVDAANLEIMRLDSILEDVGEITDSASSAVGAVETVTNAPMELMNNVTSRVRGAFKTKHASDESVKLGEAKAAAADVETEKLVSPAAASEPVQNQVADGAATEGAEEAEKAPVVEKQQEGPAYFTYGQETSSNGQ